MRWVFRILGVIVFVIVAGIAALFLLPADRIAALVEDQFQAQTGRTLSIDGDVRPGLWPEIGVNTGPVTIANADWASDAPMIEAEGLSVGVAWDGLFGGDIKVTGVELTRPVIRLEQAEDGTGNWEMAALNADGTTTSDSTGGEASTPALALERATVIDGTVIYAAPGAEPITLSAIDATLTLPDFDGAADLTLSALANGAPISADLSLASVSNLLAGAASALSLNAELGGGTIGFTGEVGLDPMVRGDLAADLPGISGLTRIVGTEAAMPAGLGQNRINVQTAMAFAGDTLSLGDTTLVLDSNTLTGDIDLGLGGTRPKITASLNAGALDLSGLTEDDTTASAPESEGWSKDPIDVSGLGAADANITLAATSIALSDSQLGRTRLGITLDDRRLVTTIEELIAYDGAVEGQVVVNGRGGLSASTDLSGSAIAISRLFAELLDFDRLITLGDMQISILTSGNNMHALINGMNGDGSFRFGAGELLGLDLVGMLKNFDTSFVGDGKATIFDEITGTFRIVDGVVINDNLQMLAPLLTATGTGEVGLGGQTLNYRITPKLLDGEISVPLLITGTWAAPKFRLDLENLIGDRVDEELEKVKDEVEDRAKAAVEKELQNLTGGEGNTRNAKEAAKDKLEDELKKGLKSLFD